MSVMVNPKTSFWVADHHLSPLFKDKEKHLGISEMTIVFSNEKLSDNNKM